MDSSGSESLRNFYSSSASNSGWQGLSEILTTEENITSSEYTWSALPLDVALSQIAADQSRTKWNDVLKALAAWGCIEYASALVVSPFEVATALLQVQWVPKDMERPTVVGTSSDGLVVGPHAIRAGSAGSIWGMMKELAAHEGWTALFKGALSSCLVDVLSTISQPIILSLLEFTCEITGIPVGNPSLTLQVASHVLTGLLVSPLELIRTRLIVHSSDPLLRPSSGLLDEFSRVLRHEGGWWGVYMHPHLLIPALLDNTMRSLTSVVLPRVVHTYIPRGIATKFVCGCTSLLVTLPFETARRRLQVQVRGPGRSIATSVQVRPVPYNGIIDALWHIATEERADLPLHSSVVETAECSVAEAQREGRARPLDRFSGVGQLYRGWVLSLLASIV